MGRVAPATFPYTGSADVTAQAAEAPPAWDLDSALDGYGTGSVEELQQFFAAEVAGLAARFEEAGVDAGGAEPMSVELVARVEAVLAAASPVLELERVLGLYHAGRCWADGADRVASSGYLQFQALAAPLAGLRGRLERWAARLPVDELVATCAVAAEHRYWFRRCAEATAHQLTLAEESLLAKLEPSGTTAWWRLYEDSIGGLTARLDGAAVPAVVLRAEMAGACPARRRSAGLAAETAWATVEVPVAASLNAIKYHALVLCLRRGWADPLDKSLTDQHVDRQMLDLVYVAIGELLPILQRFAQAKAGLLGGDAVLPWWDIAAPVPGEATLTWDEAVELTVTALRGFSPRLGEYAEHAVAHRWVDAQLRAGKRSTALCMPMRAGQSRLLVNFDGSLDSVRQLTHELGHGYHYQQLGFCTELQRTSPMCLQEVPSLLAESLLLIDTSSQRPPDHRLATLNAYLIGAFQTAAGGYARFLFEKELFLRRQRGPLTPDELCDLSVQSQLQAYGDSVQPATLPRHLWVSQPHLYTSTFGSWPYHVGLLLGPGLFDRGGTAADRLDDFLAHTGSNGVAELAHRLGADVTSRDLWQTGVEALRGRVDEFCALAAVHAA
jgi:oligoendopeptidase F